MEHMTQTSTPTWIVPPRAWIVPPQADFGTASRATAVQIAHTRRGVQTIVEHLGSAHDGWVSRLALAGDGPVLLRVRDQPAQTIDVRDLATFVVEPDFTHP